jgi:uncharacterized protein
MPKSNYSIDLIKQMAECDANYIRLLKLVPELQEYRNWVFGKPAQGTVAQGTAQGTARGKESADTKVFNEAQSSETLEGLVTEFSIADFNDDHGKVTVAIKILEAFKYTTTLEIIQKPQFKQWMTNPSMLVRAYHDANTAEVMSYQGHRNLKPRYSQPNPKMYHSDEKMQVNQFLGEWLTHCLKVGRSLRAPDLLFYN